MEPPPSPTANRSHPPIARSGIPRQPRSGRMGSGEKTSYRLFHSRHSVRWIDVRQASEAAIAAARALMAAHRLSPMALDPRPPERQPGECAINASGSRRPSTSPPVPERNVSRRRGFTSPCRKSPYRSNGAIPIAYSCRPALSVRPVRGVARSIGIRRRKGLRRTTDFPARGRSHGGCGRPC